MKTFSGSLKTWLSAAFIVGTLSGCAAAILGGAAVGANAVADRRSAGAMSDDGMMELRIQNKVREELNKRYVQTGLMGLSPEISVISYNRRILLLGQVADQSHRDYAESVARHESDAKTVFNHIQITHLPRTAANITNDTWITSKLRSRLLNVQGVYAGHVKVVTYNGVVYAMGILTPAQQVAVTEVIRTTPGVQQVVTLYENYLPNPTQTIQ